MPDKKSRVALQFNEYDFRHKKALQILRNRPRHMTELVVNAILHYVTCPDAGDELNKQWIRDVIREELAELQKGDQAAVAALARDNAESAFRDDDLNELGNVMSMFRRGEHV